jgi:hypothetical protein
MRAVCIRTGSRRRAGGAVVALALGLAAGLSPSRVVQHRHEHGARAHVHPHGAVLGVGYDHPHGGARHGHHDDVHRHEDGVREPGYRDAIGSAGGGDASSSRLAGRALGRVTVALSQPTADPVHAHELRWLSGRVAGSPGLVRLAPLQHSPPLRLAPAPLPIAWRAHRPRGPPSPIPGSSLGACPSNAPAGALSRA